MIKPSVDVLSYVHSDVKFYEVDIDKNEDIAISIPVHCIPTFQLVKNCVTLDLLNQETNRVKLEETIRRCKKRVVPITQDPTGPRGSIYEGYQHIKRCNRSRLAGIRGE